MLVRQGTGRWRPMALAAVASWVLAGSALWAQEESGAVDEPVPAREGARDAAEGDFEALLRGPIHEAFAEVYEPDPQPGVLVERRPPEPVDEAPPENMPEGNNVQWIPGYWFWDDEREDFIWISGFWRDVPPGQRWVPGYWAEEDDGVRWVPGFWADAEAQELNYLPTPPQSLEVGPTTPSPGEDYVWSPGYWRYYQADYRWRPGNWVRGYPNWCWIPPRYVWTPYGCVFVGGYWDYRPRWRGWLTNPVYFHRYPRYAFTPPLVLDVSRLLVHLWRRPGYYHYCFGDFYGPRYRGRFLPWYTFYGARRYDPLLAFYVAFYGRRDFLRRLEGWHDYYRRNERFRPPHTWAQLDDFRRRAGDRRAGPGVRMATLGTSLRDFVRDADPQRVRRLDPQARERFREVARDLRQLQRQRDLSERRLDRLPREARRVTRLPDTQDARQGRDLRRRIDVPRRPDRVTRDEPARRPEGEFRDDGRRRITEPRQPDRFEPRRPDRTERRRPMPRDTERFGERRREEVQPRREEEIQRRREEVQPRREFRPRERSRERSPAEPGRRIERSERLQPREVQPREVQPRQFRPPVRQPEAETRRPSVRQPRQVPQQLRSESRRVPGRTIQRAPTGSEGFPQFRGSAPQRSREIQRAPSMRSGGSPTRSFRQSSPERSSRGEGRGSSRGGSRGRRGNPDGHSALSGRRIDLVGSPSAPKGPSPSYAAFRGRAAEGFRGELDAHDVIHRRSYLGAISPEHSAVRFQQGTDPAQMAREPEQVPSAARRDDALRGMRGPTPAPRPRSPSEYDAWDDGVRTFGGQDDRRLGDEPDDGFDEPFDRSFDDRDRLDDRAQFGDRLEERFTDRFDETDETLDGRFEGRFDDRWEGRFGDRFGGRFEGRLGDRFGDRFEESFDDRFDRRLDEDLFEDEFDDGFDQEIDQRFDRRRQRRFDDGFRFRLDAEERFDGDFSSETFRERETQRLFGSRQRTSDGPSSRVYEFDSDTGTGRRLRERATPDQGALDAQQEFYEDDQSERLDEPTSLRTRSRGRVRAPSADGDLEADLHRRDLRFRIGGDLRARDLRGAAPQRRTARGRATDTPDRSIRRFD